MSKSFRELEAWKKSIDLVEEVYKITETFPGREKFGLSNQLQRAAVSIPSNIAEGSGRMSKGDLVRFLYIARGSLLEVITQLEIAFRLKYIDENIFNRIIEKSEEVHRLINGMIFSLKDERSKKW